MQYPNYDETADIEVINNNIKKLVQNAEEQDAQIKSKEPAIGEKNSGFNKVKTDLVENDTNKVFSAKGAFDLKNWLVTNYTTLMNNINNDIATKLPHGGYSRTAQDLKNDVDTKANKAGDTFTGDLKISNSDFIVDGRCRFYGGTELQFINSESDTTGISFFRGKGGDRGDTTNFYKYHSGFQMMYDSHNSPKSSSLTSTSEVTLATSKAVKLLNDLKEPVITNKRSGWNLEKTDLTENETNKLFSAKGALNLFNTLTTNFTDGINAAKEVLRLDIVKKLNKGAYLGDAQDLKNEIDAKVSRSGGTFTGPVNILKTNLNIDGVCRIYGESEFHFINSESDVSGISFFRGKGGGAGETTNFYKYRSGFHMIYDSDNSPKSSSVTSTSETTLATSKAVSDVHSMLYGQRQSDDGASLASKILDVNYNRSRKRYSYYCRGTLIGLEDITYFVEVVSGDDTTVITATRYSDGKRYIMSYGGAGIASINWYKNTTIVFIPSDGSVAYPNGFNYYNSRIVSMYKQQGNNFEFTDIITRFGDGASNGSECKMTPTGIIAHWMPNYTDYGFSQGLYVVLQKID